MGRIPEFQRSPLRSSVQLGNIEAAGTAELGIASLANVAREIVVKQKRTDDRLWVTENTVELETRSNQLSDAHRTEFEGSPVDSEEFLEFKIDDEIDDLSKSAPSQAARQSFQNISKRLQIQKRGQTTAWANRQFVVNTGNRVQAAGNNLNTQAFNGKDPRQLENVVKQHEMLMLSTEDALGAETRKELDINGIEEIYVNAFEGMISGGRPNEANALLKSNTFDEFMSIDAKKRLLSFTGRKVKKEKEIRDSTIKKMNKTETAYEGIRDALGLARVDQLPGYEPINFSSEGFERRAAWRDEVNKQFGTKAKILTPIEVGKLQEQLFSGNVDEQAGFLFNMNSIMSDDQFDEVASQLLEKNPSFGVAMAISEDDLPTTKRILQGERILKSRTQRGASRNDLVDAYNEEVGAAITIPEVRNQTMQAIEAVHAQLSKERGVESDVSNGLFEDAVLAVLGPIVEVNDLPTLSFRDDQGNFLDDDDFNNLIETLSPELLETELGAKAFYLNGQEFTTGDLRDESTYEAVGDGRYKIKLNGGSALDKNGAEYVLDLKKLSRDLGDVEGEGFLDGLIRKGKKLINITE